VIHVYLDYDQFIILLSDLIIRSWPLDKSERRRRTGSVSSLLGTGIGPCILEQQKPPLVTSQSGGNSITGSRTEHCSLSHPRALTSSLLHLTVLTLHVFFCTRSTKEPSLLEHSTIRKLVSKIFFSVSYTTLSLRIVTFHPPTTR
jgi:hypothetical protein